MSGVAESHFCSKEVKFRWMLLFSWWKQEFTAVSPGSFLQHAWLSPLPALKLGIKTFFQVKSSVQEEFSLYRFFSVGLNFFHCSQGCGCLDSGGDLSWLFSGTCPFSVCNKHSAQVYGQTKCALANIKTNAKHGVRIKGL